MEKTVALVKALAELHGTTGREDAVGQYAAERLRAYVPDAAYDNGNVTAHLGTGSGKPVLLLCAHLDQVGFMVTDITEDGFLRIGGVGGIDKRLLPGQNVTVVGAGQEEYFGVISILPPHLLQGEQEPAEISKLCVDIGVSSAAELNGKIRRGDAVYYGTKCKKLQNGLLTGSALDDRCGVAALILTAEMLAGKKLPCNVTFVFSGQEERGGRGAKLAALNERADYSIAVDVTFGMAHGESPEECMELGKGPAVGISPVLSEELSALLTDTAERKKIPCQLEIMTGKTGTDADSLAITATGSAAGTVSIPLRYMHTPVEVIDPADVVKTAELLAALAENIGKAGCEA